MLLASGVWKGVMIETQFAPRSWSRFSESNDAGEPKRAAGLGTSAAPRCPFWASQPAEDSAYVGKGRASESQIRGTTARSGSTRRSHAGLQEVSTRVLLSQGGWASRLGVES